MRWTAKLAAAALAALLHACAAAPPPELPPAVARIDAPVTILISIDSFRPDYLDRGITPTLSEIAAEGVRGAMVPCFPSKTFPNHYSLVTGVCADTHGVVANKMVLPGPPRQTFGKASTESFWWEGGTPIWESASRAGIVTGTVAWPGSAAELRGVRPARLQPWAKNALDSNIDAAIAWLDLPAAERPRLIAIYLDPVDDKGHDFGPRSAEVNTAIHDTDAAIGRLRKALGDRKLAANLIIVSDHGMADVSRDRIVTLDSIVDPADFELVEPGTYASLLAQPGREAALEKKLLGRHEHMTCWRKGEIPARFHYGRNPRIPPYFCLADLGWMIDATRPGPDKWVGKGDHGWDNALPDMRATFVAGGPAFRPGVRLAPFPLVDVYPLLRRLTGLPPETGVEGSIKPLASALAR